MIGRIPFFQQQAIHELPMLPPSRRLGEELLVTKTGWADASLSPLHPFPMLHLPRPMGVPFSVGENELLTMIGKRIYFIVAAIIISPLVMIFSPFSGVRDVEHESTQFDLRLYGSSIYEFHAATGKWPCRIEDLGQTSLPLQSRFWEFSLDDKVYVIVWHKTLKPDLKDNADQILAFHNKGLIAMMGHTWACRGDLRTEYIKTDDLINYLQNR